jgi:phytoene dehydrogenase-like protein
MFCIAAHKTGWPIVRGGAASITDLLSSRLRSLGGHMEASRTVRSLSDLPTSRVVLFDTSPAHMLSICGNNLPRKYHRAAAGYRHGPGICKVDWALSESIPWVAEVCMRAGTVHIGSSLQSIAKNEQMAWENRTPKDPFIFVTQPSVFDDSRAPPGKHVAWAYCHVPHNCDIDTSYLVEEKIEQFAPGFRKRIVARNVMTTSDLEEYNANYIGGDIAGGMMSLRQFLARPVLRLDPYSTPNPKIFICSASTPPGPGVHGMCGYYAAMSAIKRTLRNR